MATHPRISCVMSRLQKRKTPLRAGLRDNFAWWDCGAENRIRSRGKFWTWRTVQLLFIVASLPPRRLLRSVVLVADARVGVRAGWQSILGSAPACLVRLLRPAKRFHRLPRACLRCVRFAGFGLLPAPSGFHAQPNFWRSIRSSMRVRSALLRDLSSEGKPMIRIDILRKILLRCLFESKPDS